MKLSIRMIAITIFLSAALFPAGAFASETDSWQFGASLYGWIFAVEGQTAFSPPDYSGDFEVDIENILDNLEFITLMGIFDMRKGHWGLLTDVIYMDVGDSVTGTREASIGGSQIPIDAAADVNLDLESLIWTLAGYYRALDQTGMTLDVLVGTRYLDVEQYLDWNVTGIVDSIPAPGRTGIATASLSNWDCIMGVRGRFAFGAQHAWFVPYYLDLGLGDSDFTWQGIAGLGYAFKWCEITAVWRYLYYDLSEKAIKGISFNGPAVGFTFRW